MIFELNDQIPDVLAASSVLKLNLQCDFNSFFVETADRREINTFENTGKFDEFEAGRAIV